MDRVQTLNPFAKRQSYDKGTLLGYRLLTLFTWLLLSSISLYYSFKAPSKGRTIWDQNKSHPSPCSPNREIISAYWSLLLLLQLSYIYFLSAFNPEIVNAAANVGSHFILNNLFQTAFIALWVHNQFWTAEIILGLNWINLTSLYFRHSKTPRFVHYPVVTGPLCITYLLLFVNGAVALNLWSFAARICAIVALWYILLYGIFFVLAFKDLAIGWEISVLLIALAVEQARLKTEPRYYWIIAIAVAAIMLVVSLTFTVPLLFGKDLVLSRQVDDEESIASEERPLLEDD